MAQASQRRPKLGDDAAEQLMFVHLRFTRLNTDSHSEEPSVFARCLARLAALAREFPAVPIMVAAEAAGPATAHLYTRICLGQAHQALTADPATDPTASLVRRLVFELADYRPHMTDAAATASLLWAPAAELSIATAPAVEHAPAAVAVSGAA